MGAAAVVAAFCVGIVYGYVMALRPQHVSGRLLAIGLTTSIFLYVFINIAMITGQIPVVGIPLPLLFNGGTVMAAMVSVGLLLNVSLRPKMGRSDHRA